MNRCKDCRWWSRKNFIAEHLCMHPKHIDISVTETTRGDRDLLLYFHDGDYDIFTRDRGGGMNTGPDFGCVHWEAREEAL